MIMEVLGQTRRKKKKTFVSCHFSLIYHSKIWQKIFNVPILQARCTIAVQATALSWTMVGKVNTFLHILLRLKLGRSARNVQFTNRLLNITHSCCNNCVPQCTVWRFINYVEIIFLPTLINWLKPGEYWLQFWTFFFNGSSSPFRALASYSVPSSFFPDGRTPWTSDQLVARPLRKHRTTQTQNTHIHTPNIHALSGIRTHDRSVRAGEDSSCLRPHGYCDRLQFWIIQALKKRCRDT
jgi:hypothetical protein